MRNLTITVLMLMLCACGSSPQLSTFDCRQIKLGGYDMAQVHNEVIDILLAKNVIKTEDVEIQCVQQSNQPATYWLEIRKQGRELTDVLSDTDMFDAADFAEIEANAESSVTYSVQGLDMVLWYEGLMEVMADRKLMNVEDIEAIFDDADIL